MCTTILKFNSVSGFCVPVPDGTVQDVAGSEVAGGAQRLDRERNELSLKSWTFRMAICRDYHFIWFLLTLDLLQHLDQRRVSVLETSRCFVDCALCAPNEYSIFVYWFV
jgi:hypothetical protein